MSAYQNTARGGDTDFRKKWDIEEYAKLGAERESREKAESKARYEAKMSGKKLKIESLPDVSASIATGLKAEIDDWESHVGKQMLVAPGAAIGRRGKGAGKYCQYCDETFKDNISYIDHINSMIHMKRAGITVDQSRSSLEECQARLEMLKEHKRKMEAEPAYDLEARLKERRAQEEAERAAKRLQKQEKRRTNDEKQIKAEPINDGDSEMSLMMGIAQFGSTKK